VLELPPVVLIVVGLDRRRATNERKRGESDELIDSGTPECLRIVITITLTSARRD